MNRQILVVVFVVIAVVAGILLAADKPDFSGEWNLDLSRSTLAAKGIQAGTVRIVHHEPAFKFDRTFVTKDGPDRTSYELTTDGKEKMDQSGKMTTHSRLYWKDDDLVLDEKIEVGGRTATNVVHYTLADSGRTLIAKESFRGPRLQYDNSWVFDRK